MRYFYLIFILFFIIFKMHVNTLLLQDRFFVWAVRLCLLEQENNWCLFPSDETARCCGVVCFSILFTQFAIFEKL